MLELHGRDDTTVGAVVEPDASSRRQRQKERGVAIESSRDVGRHVLPDTHVVQTPRADGRPPHERLERRVVSRANEAQSIDQQHGPSSVGPRSMYASATSVPAASGSMATGCSLRASSS